MKKQLIHYKIYFIDICQKKTVNRDYLIEYIGNNIVG